MARNGSGTYNRAVAPYVAGTTITAAAVNSEMDDIAAALTQSLSRDGQSPPTANFPMGNFRITGLGNAISNTDAAPLGQVLAKAGDTATGALGVVAGTAAAPGVFVSGDTNTGLFQPAADTLAITVGGAEVARFGANGLQSASPWVDLASAATTDLGAQTTDNLRITDTTTITSFGTAPNGVTRNLRFADALTLTHNATSLILPSGANITTAAGDTGTAKSLGSGNWVLTDFQRASALPALRGSIAGSGLTMTSQRILGRLSGGTGPITEIVMGNGSANFTFGTSLGGEILASGQTEMDYFLIPEGVRQVVVMFNGLSTNGTSPIIVQIGSNIGLVTSGYFSGLSRMESSSINTTTVSSGIAGINIAAASDAVYGSIILNAADVLQSEWMAQGAGYYRTNGGWSTGGFGLSGNPLARVRVTTVGGTNTFDAGEIALSWRF